MVTCTQHHPVFAHFEPFTGEVPAFRQVDFIGTLTRQEFSATLACHPVSIRFMDLWPFFNEEYFEWIDILESIIAARESYTMIDLGAGFGRWAVRAHYAARQYNRELPCHLVAVEAEPTVFEWMGLHFQDNGIDPAAHKLIHG